MRRIASASAIGSPGGTTRAPPDSTSVAAAALQDEIDATTGRPLARQEAIFDGKLALALTLRWSTR